MMKYKCTDCGCVFLADEAGRWEERHGFNDGPGEVWTGCPHCKSTDYMQVEECDTCGDLVPVEAIYHGLCRKCLAEKVTYRTAHDFLKAKGYLVDFVFDRLFGAFVPVGENPDQKAKTEDLASKLLERKAVNDLIHDESTVLTAMVEYIIDDDPCFADSFAEWIEQEGRRHD